MKKRLFAVTGVICFAVILLILAGKQKSSFSKDAITLSDYKLNTYVMITIYDHNKEYVLKECMALCDKYELIFSRTNPDSELYQLNNGLLPRSADGYYTVSSDLYEVIATGKKYAHISDNAFSISMEPLTSLWNFTDGTNGIPSSKKIEAALPLIDSNSILLREPNQIAFSQNGIPYIDGSPVNYGMGLDLGAIAKGYIADKLKEYLLTQDIDSALIYLGGNVLCIGNKSNSDTHHFAFTTPLSSGGNNESTPFTVGIEKPFAVNGEAAATLKITDLSVVTSGTYQRYFEKDGHLYHHLLDSTTGYPHQNGLLSVTIVTASSTDADALSTTCFSLGLENGMELLENIENADGFFITEDGKYHFTEGFLEKYQVTFSE